MAEIIKMPKSGLTMREGKVAKIKISKGDAVKKGDSLMEFETDKITGDVESPRDGVVLEIFVSEGDTVEVLAPLCAVGDAGETLAVETSAKQEAMQAESIKPEAKIPETQAIAPQTGRIAASPLAKKMAKERGLELQTVQGTGPKGWIVKKDVQRELEKSRAKATPLARSIAEAKGIDLHGVKGTGPDGRIQKADVLASEKQPAAVVAGGVRREKMSGMRRTIAQRLQMSKQTIPHVYFKCEVDATAILDVKNTYSPLMQKKYGQKLSVNDIVLAATASILNEFPAFSAQVEGDELVYMDTVNLGFAVSLEKGLIVPVIRSAHKLSLAALSTEAARLTGRAKAMQLTQDEITGGTFTVSNLGGYGMEEFFAIINPPESGILAVGASMEKAVVVNGAVVIRPMMTLCLSVDHRIIDGAVAAQFMKRLKETLEDAHQLLL